MKYLCLAYLEEKELDAPSKNGLDTLAREALAYDEEPGKSGHYVFSEALQGPPGRLGSIEVRPIIALARQ